MSIDKAVDSTQLDADLTSVANAIRTKGGTSADLAFPAGFVSAVQAIPSGGGSDDLLAVIGRTVTTFSNNNVTTIGDYAFYGCDSLTSFSAPNVSYIGAQAFRSTKLTSANFPLCTSLGNQAFNGVSTLTSVNFPLLRSLGGLNFGGTSIESFALPSASGALNALVQNCTLLNKVDYGADVYSLTGSHFNGDRVLGVLVLRRSTSIVLLQQSGSFNGTPFASGGSGGTIYIPKALYDHLGDGTSLDYKAATNWSTVNGYGTITWAKIEGSIYETQYADGTPIT